MEYIKIPKNPDDLHSLTDLISANNACIEFNTKLKDYFLTIFKNFIKTLDQVLSEIPEEKWIEYDVFEFNSNLNSFYNTKYEKYKNKYFFIDHKNKKIIYYNIETTTGYNCSWVDYPKFEISKNNEYIIVTSTKIWRSGTWRRDGDYEIITERKYYFDINTNTVLYKIN